MLRPGSCQIRLRHVHFQTPRPVAPSQRTMRLACQLRTLIYFGVGVVEVVRDDLRVFFRQLDHACLSLGPLFLERRSEEVGIAGDEAAVSEQDVLVRTDVESDSVIVVEAEAELFHWRIRLWRRGRVARDHAFVIRRVVWVHHYRRH